MGIKQQGSSIMTKFKKIVAAAIATISIGAVTVTASAETILTPPINW